MKDIKVLDTIKEVMSFNIICLECKQKRLSDNGTWVCDKCLEKHKQNNK